MNVSSGTRLVRRLHVGPCLCAAAAGALLAPVFLPAASLPQTDRELPIEIVGTRVIYDEDMPSARVTVKNHGRTPWLVVLDVAEFCGIDRECTSTEDFMATPGLRVIHPAETFSFRLVRLTQELPKDVESLYLVQLRIVPSQAGLSPEEMQRSRVNLALVGTMKLFWRPLELAGARSGFEVRDNLEARCVNGAIEFVNHSPFWGTFGTIEVEGRSILRNEPRPMIAPHATAKIPVPACPAAVDVSFIAESGRLTGTRTINLAAAAGKELP